MSYDNPTAIQLGMTGTFYDVSYRVVGRVVMGVVDDGQTYCWNEFNLQADTGESATLVYEATERGGEWRLFKLFEPQFPITAEDAATKRIGDPLNLDGTDVRITLLDRSRVYHIEGQAPEGVEVGDDAQYFNAEAGKTMIVVSWTGQEVECYHGITLSAMIVGHAFSIPVADLSKFTLSGTTSNNRSYLPFVAILGIFVISLCFPLIAGLRPRSPAAVRIAAPSTRLAMDSSGILGGKTYRIVSDAVVEISEVGLVVQRHEFHLRDEDGNGALLIHGWKPGANDWCLFTLLEPSEPMTPQQAAAIRCGQSVSVANVTATANELARFVTVRVNTSDVLQSTTGRVFYCFSGENAATILLARWDEDVITFYQGHALSYDPTPIFSKTAK